MSAPIAQRPVSSQGPRPGTTRSPFVSVLAVSSIAICGLLFLTGLFSVSTTVSLMNSPEVQTAQAELNRLRGNQLSPAIDFRLNMATSVLSLLMDLGLAGASVGLLLRLTWSRRAYIGILWVNLVVMLIGSVVNHMTVQRVTARLHELESIGGTGTLSNLSFVATALTMAFGLIVAGSLTWKLTRAAVREEFTRTKGKSVR